MRHYSLHLKTHYSVLSELSDNPVLTVYIPDNLDEMGRQDEIYPAVLICPGGGYSWCSQREDEPVALKLLSWGYRVFILNYSCAPCHFPTQLCEVAAALELIHEYAASWHIDTNRIAIMGFSAGGHLAAHYSNRFDHPQVRAVFPESKSVAASILCYPVISAHPSYRHESTLQNVIGHMQITDADVETFSVDKLVSDSTPPAFIWHTTLDEIVPVSNSLLYAQALANHNIPFDLHIYTHGRHGLSTVDAMTCEPLDSKTQLAGQWLDSLQKWLNATL